MKETYPYDENWCKLEFQETTGLNNYIISVGAHSIATEYVVGWVKTSHHLETLPVKLRQASFHISLEGSRNIIPASKVSVLVLPSSLWVQELLSSNGLAEWYHIEWKGCLEISFGLRGSPSSLLDIIECELWTSAVAKKLLSMRKFRKEKRTRKIGFEYVE